MAVTITLSFRFPMGHRILGLDGLGLKCRNVHGHNWQADVELANDDGQLEFGAVKEAVGGWIEERLDHGFMLAADDPFLDYLLDNDLKHFVVDGRPDTEQVASVIATYTEKLVGVTPKRVYVLEGYRNAATWTP